MPAFLPVEELFRGRHFDQEIIVLCIRWYLSFKLSYRDLVRMMSERGIGLAAHNDPTLGAALHSGVRETVAALRPASGWLLAV
jgi:hypothetical protein